MSPSQSQALRERVLAVIAAVRADLSTRYGWTHLDAQPELDGAALRLTGTVAVPRILDLLRASLAAELPELTAIQLELGPMPVRSWHRLADATTELWAEHPGHRSDPALATELLEGDGPVGLLAAADGACLVRARDGTVGWLRGELGPACPAPSLPGPSLPADPGAALVAAALAYRGVRYQLGGTTHARIDCSGLVARAFAAALAVTLPRNSNDQRALVAGEPLDRVDGAAGDLVFLRSRRLGRTHVGLLTGAGTVVHASRTRDAVVEEPARSLEGDAEWLLRIRWPALVEWARAQAGRPGLALPAGPGATH